MVEAAGDDQPARAEGIVDVDAVAPGQRLAVGDDAGTLGRHGSRRGPDGVLSRFEIENGAAVVDDASRHVDAAAVLRALNADDIAEIVEMDPDVLEVVEMADVPIEPDGILDDHRPDRRQGEIARWRGRRQFGDGVTDARRRIRLAGTGDQHRTVNVGDALGARPKQRFRHQA